MKHALILSASALVLMACNNDTAGDETAATRVDEATALSALEALHLAESGQGAVSWEERTFDNGVFTFTGLTFVMYEDDADTPDEDGEEGESLDVEFETNSFTAETMTVTSPRFDEAGNVIFNAIAMNGITLGADDEDFTGTIGRFTVEEPNSQLVMAFADGFSGEPVDEDEIENDEWRYGLFAIEDLAFSGTEEGNEFSAGFGTLSVTDLGDYAIGQFVLSDLLIDGTDDEVGRIHFALEEVSADGIGEAMTYPFVAQFAMLGAAFEADVPNEDIDADIPDLPEDFDPLDSYDNITVRGLDVNVGGVMVTLDSLRAWSEERGGDLVYTSEMTPLTVAPDTNFPLGAQMALGLGMLGYQQLEFVSAGATVYDRDADRAYTEGDNYFEMTDGFRVEVESDVSGIMAYTMNALSMTTAMDEPDTEQVMEMLEPLVLSRFVFRLEDLSLLDRALTAASAAQGMPKEQLRMQAGGLIMMATMGAPAEIPRPLLTQFSTAMSTFIAEGGSVEVRIEPETPVSVGALVGQAEAGTLDLDAMGITIAAIPPETSGE
jgi:hypothetical protein